MLGYKKGNKKLLTGQIPLHYPADRVYLDGDTTKNVQDKVARKADLTNLDLTGATNTTGSTIASGTYFYLNGTLVIAKTDIANGATFTSGTNYENAIIGKEVRSTKVRRQTVTATLSGYGYFGWIAPKAINVISAYCEDHIIMTHKRSDGWYVSEMNATGTGFVSGNTLSITYTYTIG